MCSFSVLLALISLLSIHAISQELSAQPESGAKVCVAIVNNQTAERLDQDRMTARLVKALADKKLSPVAMDSATGNSRDLRPTLENSHEMKDKECDYLVLTMITGSSNYNSPEDREITIGHAKVPSVDASDPMGGQSGPVYRNELKINFAVFRPGNLKPVLDTRIQDRTRANASDSLMDAMDREGSRVSQELKKK
jgi:hypothetical protein